MVGSRRLIKAEMAAIVSLNPEKYFVSGLKIFPQPNPGLLNFLPSWPSAGQDYRLFGR
jgi:hypothetical protein